MKSYSSVQEINDYIHDIYIARLSIIAELLKLLHDSKIKYQPGGVYTNLRDTLFHFRQIGIQLKETPPDFQKINFQMRDIDHHLNRALSDAFQFLSYSLIEALDYALIRTAEIRITEVQTNEIRKIYHNTKNFLLNIRLGNMEINNDFQDAMKMYTILTEDIKKFFTITNKSVSDWLLDRQNSLKTKS